MKSSIFSVELLRSRKGVSGSISGVFLILLSFLAMGALFIYAVNVDRYNQEVNVRAQLDWERENEKFQITSGQRNNNGTLNMTIFNHGGVTAHLVDLWVTYKNAASNESLQSLYRVDYYLNPAGQLSEVGGQNATQLPSGSLVTCINLTEAIVPEINYTIKIVSERGNSASFVIKHESSDSGDSEGGGYSLIISEVHDNFQYAKINNMTFLGAYVKPRSTTSTLYRVLLNNTTSETIYFHENCTLLQTSYAGGAYQRRYIVDNSTSTFDAQPTEFVSQVLNPGASQYIYFAGDSISNPDWAVEPDKKEYYFVGFLMFFMYEGDTEVRSVGLPVLTQELT